MSTELSTRCRKLLAINMALNACASDVALVSSLKFSRSDARSFVRGQQTLPFGFHSKRPLPTAQQYSTIVACEIVYEDEVVGPLWAAIQELLTKAKESIFILGYYMRSARLQEDLLTHAAASGFCYEEVPQEQYLPVDAGGYLRETLQIASDEEWTAAFMNNWKAESFHIYLFRWAPSRVVL